MKKRILIPTDFSENSINAIRYAVALYEDTECDFHILHSFFLAGDSKEKLLIPEPGDADYQNERAASEKKIENLKTQLSALRKKAGHNFYFSSEMGPLLDVLRKKIKKEEIDLVVMGTRGQNDAENMAFGSVAVSVMENIRLCPTLAIPRNTTFIRPNEIVFPTGFKTNYKLDDLNGLMELSKLTDSPVRILYVSKGEGLSKGQAEKKNFLEKALDGIVFSHHNLYHVAVKTGVRNFVQSRGSEMIAFVNKKHFFFGGIFSDPMVKQLGRYANVPLFAMHDVRK